jgi:hypothetical protein
VSVRVLSETTKLTATPGSQVHMDLDVTNTADVIDGVTVRVIGLDPGQVTSTPALLPLFPDASGRIGLRIDVPLTFPAGRHPLTVEVMSSVRAERRQHVDVDLVVAPRPQLKLALRPAVQRARRRSQHLVECRNSGNVPLSVVLTADDPERSLRTSFAVPSVVVEPATTGSVMLTVRAKRRFFGSDLDRPLNVRASATEHDVEDDAVAVLRHRPLVPRGVLTVGVLVLIIGLWAGAFLLGLTKVFSGDPYTKTAPASFFVSSNETVLQAAGSSLDALAKSGTLPAGVGGGIAGTVTASSTGAPTGRIVVTAVRIGRNGPVRVASAASQADGSYLLLGLLPGKYYVQFGAPGFRDAWFPSAAALKGAKLVDALPQAVTRGIDANVVGLPASISGQVDPGDAPVRPRTKVTARALLGNPTVKPAAEAVTDASGRYVLRGLPAPGTYELGFTTPGYAPTTVIEKVGGGQARSEPTVRLSAGDGSISGLVLADSGGTPAGLGEVTVSTSQDGRTLSTATPTQGQVGHFALTGLATPGTYVVTFVKPGFGAFTRVVGLAPGQQVDLRITLRSGTGAVTGVVRDSAHNPLGGVTVTVGGTAAPMQTTTLTDGTSKGSYSLTGLPVPGSYTLTFSLPGFAPQTLPLNLALDAPSPPTDAVLAKGFGRVTGLVMDDEGTAVVGATVTVTDGLTVRTTITVQADGTHSAGSFVVPDLPPATYTVTVTRDGARQQTALVTVVAAHDACQNLRSILTSKPANPDPPPCG